MKNNMAEKVRAQYRKDKGIQQPPPPPPPKKVLIKYLEQVDIKFIQRYLPPNISRVEESQIDSTTIQLLVDDGYLPYVVSNLKTSPLCYPSMGTPAWEMFDDNGEKIHSHDGVDLRAAYPDPATSADWDLWDADPATRDLLNELRWW